MALDVSKSYNWIGKTGWKGTTSKLPFKDLHLASVIVGEWSIKNVIGVIGKGWMKCY